MSCRSHDVHRIPSKIGFTKKKVERNISDTSSLMCHDMTGDCNNFALYHKIYYICLSRTQEKGQVEVCDLCLGSVYMDHVKTEPFC